MTLLSSWALKNISLEGGKDFVFSFQSLGYVHECFTVIRVR